MQDESALSAGQNAAQDIRNRSLDGGGRRLPWSVLSAQSAVSGQAKKSLRKDFTNARAHTINAPMNIGPRSILFVAPVALASVSWLSNAVMAADFEQARVTQVVQDVKVVPSGAAARQAAVNETVHQGSAVQTGTQSRSELTFQDQTITRLGENTIFTVGHGGRTIDLGSGQFLLYVPKKAGGAKIKMGSVTAAITGTTVMGHVYDSGIVEFTVLEGSACIHLDKYGQSIYVQAGQKVVYDPALQRLENPVDVDIQEQLSSPLVHDFRQLPSAALIDQEIQIQHGRANDELARAVSASGATIETATPEQFLAAFDSLIVRADPQLVCALVGRAARARPDLADRIAVAAITSARPVRGYSKDFKQPVGKEIPCEWVQCILQAAIAADPQAEREIIDAALAAAPMMRDCILAVTPCPGQNAFIQPYVVAPINPANYEPPPVSPEQPPTSNNR
jgi:FecR protein